MNILVMGAGVIGTVYAARLRQGGHAVTLLARGERYDEIRRHQLLLDDVVTHRQSSISVTLTDHVTDDEPYDLALIAVRRDQLASLMPDLESNTGVQTMLFMLNNPAGATRLAQALGEDRVVVGFPGVGGTRGGGIVRYAVVPQQPTTLGEINGRRTPRVLALARTIRGAGLPVVVTRDVDSWLKTHAIFVTAVCGALYMTECDCRRLSGDHTALALMVRGVSQGFGALRSLGVTVTPASLGLLFSRLPQSFAVAYWRRYFRTPVADCVFGGHARHAGSEMRMLANDCRALIAECPVDTSALGRLYTAIETCA